MNVDSTSKSAGRGELGRVLLISANPNYPAFVSPYGLEVLAASLVKHLGAEVRIADPFLKLPFTPSLSHLLSDFRPHVVGIGMRNLDIWFGCDPETHQVGGRTCVAEVVALARFLVESSVPAEHILVGGAGFSIAPVSILRRSGLRYGVVGPGGKAIVDFLRAVMEGASISHIPGLVTCDDDPHVRLQPLPVDPEYDLNLVPQRSGPHRFLLRRRNLPFPLRTRSGCGNACSFCCEGRTQSFPAVVRSLTSIEAELDWLKEQQAERIILADGEFNQLSLAHTESVVQRLCERGFSWRAYALPHFPSDAHLDLLRRSGCESLLLTVDSASPQVLNRIGRPVDTDEIGVALERYLSSGIDVQATLIFGLPCETWDSLDQTLDLVRSFPRISFNYACGARLYANTPLFGYAKCRGDRHVYGAGTADPLGISIYCEPAPPWEVEAHLRDRLLAATNLSPIWATVSRTCAARQQASRFAGLLSPAWSKRGTKRGRG